MVLNLKVVESGAGRDRDLARKASMYPWHQPVTNAGNEKSPSMTGFLFMCLVKSPGFEFDDKSCR
jgi:hypothetical protein